MNSNDQDFIQKKWRLDHLMNEVEKPEPIMQFFKYDHLPEHLQKISKPFGDLAEDITATLPRNPERSTALRKLLEAKDAAVRARLFK